MQTLEKPLRSQLERAVLDAREVAEKAACDALEQLGVGEASPYAHLSEEERNLRRKLRIHGRQLGDRRHASQQTQELDYLIEEVAYEHWHRMLFARFLAENNLLMYPDPDDPVAITLEECEELAGDEGAVNGWELAARYAARMLPQIFRPDSPIFQLNLSPEYQQKLESLVAKLPVEVFTASDSLGWVYQFWQTKKKAEVNASEVKIGAKELPAVTQLFTEPYMVDFLLDNSLGAWWAARNLSKADLAKATSEVELRSKAAIPGVSLEYLRFVQQENGSWTPAAGTFDGWPEKLSELKALDPCCGSGHFLVAAFLMLVPMRMERDGFSAKEAVNAVLSENIHGLELDQRCVELAAFALALTAWKYPSAGGYRPLPELHLACSGLAISTKKEEWLALAGDNVNLRLALEELYTQFKDAPVLGSLINPRRSLSEGSLLELKWEEVEPLLKKAMAGEKDDEKLERASVAQGITKASSILAAKYSWVITNVPYLSRSSQNDLLREFCDIRHPHAKHDLANVFLERCLNFNDANGITQVVMPQNWLFLSRYKHHRETLLVKYSWSLLGILGPGAFETISGEVVKAILISLENAKPVMHHKIFGIDVSTKSTALQKDTTLTSGALMNVDQKRQFKNPDCRVLLSEQSHSILLNKYSESRYGLRTADTPRFIVKYWEVYPVCKAWVAHQSTVKSTNAYSGREHLLYWDGGRGDLKTLAELGVASLQGGDAWGSNGIAVSLTGELRSTLYTGDKFDNNCAAVWPLEEKNLAALWCFCLRPEYNVAVRQIDQNLKVTNATLLKVPFDLKHWTSVAEEKYPNGLPKPYTDDATQWTFHGHPCGSVVWNEETKLTTHGSLRLGDTVLQVAVARLLGYRWPAELNTSMELADEQRECVNRCNALLPHADEDGIVCIPPVRGEASASDRLLNLLAAAYGDAWSNDIQAKLLKNANHSGKSLETWLREKFFTQHCKLFQHRPFIWHVWDGLHDGFAALVNYHKLDSKSMEVLIHTYLGDWISRQKQDTGNGVDGAQERLAAAKALKKKLELILEGEAPYDIFVRWKPIEKQPIGWEPDLNDGVRLNIRPFMTVPDVGKRGAGVLRDKPNIKWTKDRGKDVATAPWYPVFEGDRINDHHLSLSEKQSLKS